MRPAHHSARLASFSELIGEGIARFDNSPRIGFSSFLKSARTVVHCVLILTRRSSHGTHTLSDVNAKPRDQEAHYNFFT
jgi:hypothetical protein